MLVYDCGIPRLKPRASWVQSWIGTLRAACLVRAFAMSKVSTGAATVTCVTLLPEWVGGNF
jgi:hypothetical protein